MLLRMKTFETLWESPTLHFSQMYELFLEQSVQRLCFPLIIQ